MNPTSTPMAPGTSGYTSSAAPGSNMTPGANVGPIQASKVVNATTPSEKITQLGEIGRSGTFIYSGIITNEDYNLELSRFEGIRKYEIMRRSDSTIAAMLDAVKLPIETTTWHIKPASEDPQDIEAADLCRQELFGRKIVFPRLMQDALLMLDFGYSVVEKVRNYTYFTNAQGEKRLIIGLDKLAFRKHRSIYKWETVDNLALGIKGGQPGITQYVPGGIYTIPMEKLVIFTNRKEGENHEGISLLRRVYKDWDLKDKLVLINAIRHERQGLGIIQVIAPDGASQDDIDQVIAGARAARASEEAVFQNTEGYIVEFMDMKAGSSSLTNIIETIEYHDKQILLAVLAQFIMLGSKSKGGSGGRAQSEDQSKLFELGLEAVAKNIAATIQESVIKELCDLNFSNLNGKYPTLEFDKIGDDNIERIGTVVATLLQANGLTMDPDLEQFLRDMLHAPALPDDVREDYANRLINSGKMNLPDPTSPASTVKNPATSPKSTTNKPAGNTKLHASDTDALELLRQTKKAALELLANEYATA